MRRETNRSRRDDDDFGEYEERPRRAGAFRREYDEDEREFVNRSRRRDEGAYGRAYGGGGGGDRFANDDFERRGSREPERSRMGWGRWEDDEGRGRNWRPRGPRESEEDRSEEDRLGYWSQSRRGEYGGGEHYSHGRQEETPSYREEYGRGRGERFEGVRGSDYGQRSERGWEERDRFGGGGSRSRYEEEDEPRSEFGRRRMEDYEDEDYRPGGRGAYVAGRHRGSNIGQSQMDYDVTDYRQGGARRGGSRWEEEDVVTRGRGRQQGDGGRATRGVGGTTYDLEDEEGTRGRGDGGSGRRGAARGGRAAENRPRGMASQRTRTSMGRDRLGAGARKKSRTKKSEETAGRV